jgi:GTP cyclohydrolase I
MKSGENIKNTNLQVELENRIENATTIFGDFLEALGFHFKSDPQMKETPGRVAKMFAKELFQGCYTPEPKFTIFPNTKKYDEMIFEGNIEVNSVCCHHLMPFVGVCHIAYIPRLEGNITGLSKLNRVVEWFSRRPQIQEELTAQIHDYLKEKLNPLGLAVNIEALHYCVKMRGVKHHNTSMITSAMSGVFLDNKNLARTEFLSYISNLKK